MLKFLIVALVSTLSLGKEIIKHKSPPFGSLEDLDHAHITVNSTAIDELVKDMEDFRHLYMEKTKDQREQLIKALGNAYKNARAKATMNFGKTVVPVLEEWAEYAKNL